jgi:uncharacterized protein YfaS (alpha-2-macroglobulin family)
MIKWGGVVRSSLAVLALLCPLAVQFPAQAQTAGAPGATSASAMSLGFLPSGINDEARRYMRGLKADATAADNAGAAIAEGLQALARGNQREAIRLLRSGLREQTQDVRAWIALSDALLTLETDDYSEKYRLPQDASAAALNGYNAANNESERAEALAALARALEKRQLYRAAIEAYKESLTLADSAAVRSAFDTLRRERGFRITDYSVDNDAASPRLCIRFSEKLAPAPDGLAKFFTVNQTTVSEVQVEDQQVCIDGLKHGERYQIGVRPGIPSQVDEVLERPARLQVYVKDRTASVRFTGRNFVLPPLGAQTIPVISVNAEAVDLELYRIGDRGLSGAIAEKLFLSQLDGYQAGEIASERGEKVWSGKLDVRLDLNKEVTTGFPVTEVLPERKSGVYVLRARPTSAADVSWQDQATQWFVVSDIGLSTIAGAQGLHVMTRSLSTAKPLGAVELTLVARNNEVLGRVTADADGYAYFNAGVMRGTGGLAPSLVMAATKGGDFGFLDLGAPAFDLSDRGVDGRPTPGPTDVFLYTDRGIYRPGETVHAVALLRDASATAITNVPLLVVVERPDGVEHSRQTATDEGQGGHALSLTIPTNAMRGSWRFKVYLDPRGQPLAQSTVLVEDFVPDRLELELAGDEGLLRPQDSFRIDATGRFLYGAPAAGMKLEGDLTIRAVTTLAGYPGYVFGLADENSPPVRRPLPDLPETDAEGKAIVDIVMGELPSGSQPLEALVSLRLREAGGRAVEQRFTRPLQPRSPLIGIKPRFEGGSLGQGSLAEFDVIAVGRDLARIAETGARWTLYRVERNYQWYMVDGEWNYEPVSFTRKVADGAVNIGAERPALIQAKVDWGRYRLDVTAPDGATASVGFNAGWYVEAATADTPDALEVSLDKSSYKSGDVARLKISPRFAGIATVTVMSNQLLAMQTVEVDEKGTVVELPVNDSWQPGVYVTATLYRPADQREGRMPSRAIGVAWLKTDMSERTLDVTLEAPDVVRPNGRMEVMARVAGAKPGSDVFLTLAAVDVGILNLTRFQTPKPDAWLYGQRRMGMDIRDIYGQLIDSMSAAAGNIRSGGSESGGVIEGSPPTQPLMAAFSGIVRVGEDGTVPISFDIPQFNGTARLMAVAWNKEAVGSAERDVIIRDPVVVSASVPRFLSLGDEARITLEVANTDAPAGDYTLSVTSGGEITVDDSSAEQVISIGGPGSRQVLTAQLKGAEIGLGIVTLTLSGEQLELQQELFIPVQPALQPTSRRVVEKIAKNSVLSIDGRLFPGKEQRGGRIDISVMKAGGIDVPTLLLELDRYPYGCAEQLTSRALPLLYFNALAKEIGIARDADVGQRINTAITDVLAKQSSNGSFGLWSPGSGDLWLDSYVTDFLTRAREAGHAVPDRAFGQALDNLQNQLSYSDDMESGGEATAYALYVLARNKRAAIGDLRYYVDTRLKKFTSPLSKAQLGAALALYGERERAQQAFDAAIVDLSPQLDLKPDEISTRRDYGSRLRDAAGTLALMLEVKPAFPLDQALVERLNELRAATRRTSTQENAWMLLAAHGLMQSSGQLDLAVDGTPVAGSLFASFERAEVDMKPVQIANRSDQVVDAVMTITGLPDTPPPAGGDGFTIERLYYDLAGNEVDISSVAQNERFVVVLKVIEQNAVPSRLMVVDPLPAGFEIDNPSLVKSADLAAFPWLPEEVNAAHTEFRSDRFMAAFDRTAEDDREITLAYVVRAVTPGRYAHPAAHVEDMYRPELRGWTAQGAIEVTASRQ